MQPKGSSGSRRWIERRPIDRRPIVGMHDDSPAWLNALERIAPIGCFVIGAIVLAIAGYAWLVDFSAGHIHHG